MITDEEKIKLLRSALYLAGYYCRAHEPGFMPEDLSAEDYIYLYTDTDNDPIGERFVNYFLKEARSFLFGGLVPQEEKKSES